jgi:tight adherence protein B
MKLSLRIGSSASISTAVVLLMTRSLVIAAAFGTLAAGIAFVTVKTKSSLNEAALVAAWPEVIDHLMSGIQSGLSLSESLAGLATRGPEVLRPFICAI